MSKLEEKLADIALKIALLEEKQRWLVKGVLFILATLVTISIAVIVIQGDI